MKNLKKTFYQGTRILTPVLTAMVILLTGCEKDDLLESTAEEIQEPVIEQVNSKNLKGLPNQLYSGYDIMGYLEPGSAVNSAFTDLKDGVRIGGTETNYSLSYISNEQEIDEFFSLQTSSNISFERNTPGLQSVNGEVGFETNLEQSFKSNTKQVLTIIQATVSGPKLERSLTSGSETLSTGAIDLINKYTNATSAFARFVHKDNFERNYGQGFVSSITKGFKFYFVYRLDYSNTKNVTSSEIITTLSGGASTPVGGGSASSEISTNTIRSLQSKGVVITIDVYSNPIFTISEAPEPGTGALANIANKFVEDVKNTPFDQLPTVDFTVSNYNQPLTNSSEFDNPAAAKTFLNQLYREVGTQEKIIINQRKRLTDIQNLRNQYLQFASTYSKSVNLSVLDYINNEFDALSKKVSEQGGDSVSDKKVLDHKKNLDNLKQTVLNDNWINVNKVQLFLPSIGDATQGKRYIKTNDTFLSFPTTPYLSKKSSHFKIVVVNRIKGASIFQRNSRPIYRIFHSNDRKFDTSIGTTSDANNNLLTFNKERTNSNWFVDRVNKETNLRYPTYHIYKIVKGERRYITVAANSKSRGDFELRASNDGRVKNDNIWQFHNEQ
ncbi:hypothetical protein [Aquimarina sp. 2201CG14-23]|uniref:hypothetical protein n=1 Tax=Aquimarina mycalae TaxID=3040073 RepID=UPI00247814B6|nr:hypothetical protein [Aquimarina sp. 2201CG14-23]MDH7444215.1 hypothetical protein [Aquimarina sp. 2201CG14-23]